MILKKLHISLLIVFLLPIFVFGQQEIKVELGKKNIPLEENFSIKVIIKNASKWEIKGFPSIKGFSKGGSSTAHSINAQKIATHTIIQNYTATKEGTYKVKPFELTINGEPAQVEGTTINVKEGILEDTESKTTKPSNQKLDAFVALRLDKEKIYVGEGMKVTINFYVDKDNTIEMIFPENDEIETMAKKIQSSDCLIERLLITDITPTLVEENGKKYDAFKLFEAIYYPLNNKTINFPSVTWKMLKVKNNKEKEVIAFTSKPLTIKPLSLPDHPLKNKVVAGNFSLNEKIDGKNTQTGKSFTYTFRIIGEGNFTTVNMPAIPNDSYFDFYPPTIKTNKIEGKINGEKSFVYNVVAKEAGEKLLDRYFYWVFFNTKKEKYDTLKSKRKIVINGNNIQTKIEDNSDDIYKGIDKLDTSEIETNYREVTKNIANFLLIIMFISTLFLIDYRRKKNF